MASHNDTTKKIDGWNVVGPKVYKDDNPQERVSLGPDAFDRFLNQKGVWVKVFRTTYCPNVKSIDGAHHNIDCPLCNGSGFYDAKPICIKATINSQNKDTPDSVAGYVDDNEVLMTFPIGIELQYFTLIELRDFSDIYTQRVARSYGDIDQLKFKALRVNMLVDQNGIEYTEGTDFCLTSLGQVNWKDGNGPAAETIYSIHYEAAVRFRAVKAIHVNRFTQVKVDGGIAHMKMPENWMCTKEFLLRQQDESGEDLDENPVPGYEDETTDE